MKIPSTVSVWPWWAWRVCWLVAAICIIVNGAATRFTLPQLPFIAPDSFFFILPAVNGGVYNIGPRTFVYPMFCRAVLQVTDDWRAFSVVQHLLGLLGPTLLLAGWYLLGARLWVARRARAAHELLGLALLLLLVPSAVYVIYEKQIVLESLSAFLQCCLGAILCVLWLPTTPKRRLVLTCITATLGVFMYYANPRWGASAPLVVALATIAAIIGRNPLRSRMRAAWPVLVSSALVYFGLGRVQSQLVPSDPWLDTFTAKHLLWMHADLAINEFRDDLAKTHPPEYAELLRRMIPKIEKEIVGLNTSHWRTITFNANALLYVADCPDAMLAAYFKGNPGGYRWFCLRYYARIVWHQSVAYFGEVWRMLIYYYHGPQDDGAFREFSVGISDVLPGCAPVVRYAAGFALPPKRARLEALAADMERKITPPLVFGPSPWFANLVHVIYSWFLAVTLAGVGSATTILLWPRLRTRRELTVQAWLCLSSVSVLFAQVLTLAMVTVTEGRYADALRSLAVFSLVCAIATTVSLGVRLTRMLTPGGPRTPPPQ